MKVETNQKLVCISCTQWKPLVGFLHRDEQGAIVGQIYCCEECLENVADGDIKFESRVVADRALAEKMDEITEPNLKQKLQNLASQKAGEILKESGYPENDMDYAWHKHEMQLVIYQQLKMCYELK